MPLALGQIGVACAGLDADGQAHLFNRGHQVTGDIHGQGLERRDIEGVDPLWTLCGWGLAQVNEAGQEACQGLAAAGRGDEQHMAARLCPLHHRDLMVARSPALRREPVLKLAGQDAGLRRRGALHGAG